jgi:GntR family transcriptional regulator, phosphonate transport system regulatory protein
MSVQVGAIRCKLLFGDGSMTTPAFTPTSDEPDTRLWPLWRQVEQAILASLGDGLIKPGDRLPGEHHLSEKLGAHRHTVRRALESLIGRGVLEIRRGKGTFVAERPIPYRIGRHSRFTENMREAGREPGVRVLRAATVPASGDVANALALPVGAPVVHLELLRSGDGVPILIARHSMPAVQFPDFAERFTATHSITRTFASYGVVGYSRKLTKISARQPSPQDAQELRQSSSVPVLYWASVNVDDGGRPINHDASVFAASRVDVILADGDP